MHELPVYSGAANLNKKVIMEEIERFHIHTMCVAILMKAHQFSKAVLWRGCRIFLNLFTAAQVLGVIFDTSSNCHRKYIRIVVRSNNRFI